MRFLINEKSYEYPVAAGLLRYAQDGVATGTLEHWRMTRTVQNDLIVRVDLDARGNGGSSYLYHWIEDKNGVLQRLIYRCFGDDLRTSGSILFEDEHIINSRVVGDKQIEDVVSAENLLFPTTTGLALLARAFSGGTVALLDMYGDGMKLIGVEMEAARDDGREIVVGQKTVSAETHTLSWQDHKRTIQHQAGLPLTVSRHDGLTATAAQFILY